ncbi:MAG: hypothetical protein Fur0010_00920 [Bdellovibrio sp.]
MSLLKSEDGQKWINSFVAIISIIVGFIAIRLAGQLGEWFDLEAKINNFVLVAQGFGVVIGLAVFVLLVKNKQAVTHMQEVYSELLKVVWPDKDTVVKVTFGIIVALIILSSIFVGVDFLIRKSLELLY